MNNEAEKKSVSPENHLNGISAFFVMPPGSQEDIEGDPIINRLLADRENLAEQFQFICDNLTEEDRNNFLMELGSLVGNLLKGNRVDEKEFWDAWHLAAEFQQAEREIDDKSYNYRIP